jgi:hypothetical protein
MDEREYCPPDLAASRIIAIRDAAKRLNVQTGGDPAECIFELVCAAILIAHEARPVKPPAEMIASIAPAAADTVEHWFPDMLKGFRCRHG